MEGLEIIKQLVDSLTVSLTNILLKIESINPILTNIANDVKENGKASEEAIDAIKELKHEIMSYHDFMVQLPVAIKEISEIYQLAKLIDSKLDDIKQKTDSIPDISEEFSKNTQVLSPISKIADWFTTPIGKLAGIAGAILAIAGVAETIQWILDTFFNK